MEIQGEFSKAHDDLAALEEGCEGVGADSAGPSGEGKYFGGMFSLFYDATMRINLIILIKTARAKHAESTRRTYMLYYQQLDLLTMGFVWFRPHKVTQYKKGKDLFTQGKRHYDRKQSGYGCQTKPVLHKKVRSMMADSLSSHLVIGQDSDYESTKKVVLQLECTVCKYKMQLLLKQQYKVLTRLILFMMHFCPASGLVERQRPDAARRGSYFCEPFSCYSSLTVFEVNLLSYFYVVFCHMHGMQIQNAATSTSIT